MKKAGKVLLGLAGVLVLLVVLPGIIVRVTREPLHPQPSAVPATVQVAPAATYATSVAKSRQLALRHLTSEDLPGLSVAVGVDGAIVWAEGFGYADLRTSLPVTPDHRFRIGTASAALTSAAVGQLIEEGRLKLDEDIRTYVPSFPKKQWPVTLRHLVTHSSGVVSDGGDEGSLFGKRCQSPAEALPEFAEQDLLFQPGSRFRRSRYGFIVVSAAIEAVTGEPFLVHMKRQVFDRAGMRDTVPDPHPVEPDDDFPIANLIRELFVDPRSKKGKAAAMPNPATLPEQRATPYFPRYGADPKYGRHLMRPLELSCYSGAGVFIATPSDLVRFGLAVNGDKLMKPETADMLLTGEGQGWEVGRLTAGGKELRFIGHDGDVLGGNVASLVMVPDAGLSVAVAANISYAASGRLAKQIAEVFAEGRGEL